MTQREWDILQLEAKQKMDDIYQEWLRSFIGSRVQVSTQASSVAQLPPPEEVVSY